MTLTELKYIVAVAREKHFGRAAKSCHVSQPTLSIAISKLEAELGIDIFERANNDIRVTELGEQIIAQAKKVLEEADNIKVIASANKQQTSMPLKVGAIYTIAPYLFPAIIPKLKRLAPDMPLLIQENFTAVLKSKLQMGEVDAIFVALPFSDSNILTQALFDEPFVVLMRKAHPLANKEAIKHSDLDNEEILLLGEGHCLRDQVIAACPACRKPNSKQTTVEGTSLETLRHMVASGLGITILPSSATQIRYYQSILCTKPFKEAAPRRRVALAWRASFPRPKAIGALIETLKASKLHGICVVPEIT